MKLMDVVPVLLEQCAVPSLLGINIVNVKITICTWNQQSRELSNPTERGEVDQISHHSSWTSLSSVFLKVSITKNITNTENTYIAIAQTFRRPSVKQQESAILLCN